MSRSALNIVDAPSGNVRPADEPGDAPARVGPTGDRLVIGIDLGGTKLLGAIAGPDGQPLAEREMATTDQGPVTQVRGLVGALLADVGAEPGDLGQIVVGVPGVVDDHGAVSLSPHVVFPPHLPFADTLASDLCVPVYADNDANIAAFGEYGVQDGSHPSAVVLVTIGTGVGMGIVVNGRIIRGAHGAAGEIGSMPFSGSAPLAQVRSYEGLVSTSGILGGYRAAGGQLSSVREIFDAAERGEGLAHAVIERCLDDVANGLGVVVSLLDPGLIVLGGGIGARPGVAERVAARLAALVPTPCAVVASRLGTRAGLVGALAMADQLAQGRSETAA